MNVGIVGAGPAGALLAWRLARDGARVSVFDASHPREKPCGGGLTGRALALLPPEEPDDPLPVRHVRACRFEWDRADSVEVRLETPVAVAARRDLDGWLLRRATRAGARHVPERVVTVDPDAGVLRSAVQREERFDFLVGADGASSLVRRKVLGPTPPPRLMIAAGWFAPGDADMVVRFVPGLAGYLWLFPRPGHVGVGICGPLGAAPTRELLGLLEAEVQRSFPAVADADAPRYAHTIPSPAADPRSILEAAGGRWALVGDAAAFADPITGEGIAYALQSAALLADTLRAGQPPAAYAQRALEEFGRELLKAAAVRERFYQPGFARRLVAFTRRSAAVREVLADLVLGTQGYVGLKRRLASRLPRFACESAIGWLNRSVRSSVR